jgi:hypothetical protein
VVKGGRSTKREDTALTPQARLLLAAAAVAYAVTGVPLFLTPEWGSENFAWTVSPFVAMTAGAWCLGTAVFTFYGIDRRRWRVVRPCVVYTFAFGVSQLAVALYERDLLRTREVLTWPYLAALGLSIVGGGVALVQGRRHLRPDRGVGGLPVTPFIRFLMVVFVALVFSLAAVAFAAPTRATNGVIFPEPLSLFSLRAFGVFYMSLGVAMLILMGDRRAAAFLLYMRAGLVLVVLILIATGVYAGSFDLSEHPFQIVYPMAYVAALVGAVGSLWWERQRRPGRGRRR